MVQVFIVTIIYLKEKVNGKMEKELDGLIDFII